MNKEKRITLAKIAGPHGVKGLIKILPFGEDITLLEDLPLFTDKGAPIKITLKNAAGKFVLAEADIIKTREDAQSASGTELQINQSDLPEIHEEDTYYHHDLIGLKAMSHEGKEIGTVIGVDNYGAGDLLEISKTSGEKFLIPFTNDYVPEIDLSKGTLIIIPMQEI